MNKTHTFRGRKYQIYIGGLDGYADVPGKGPWEIWLNTDRNGRQFLETAVHEAIHAEDPKTPERVVDRRAKSMARWLWSLGYRRTGELDG